MIWHPVFIDGPLKGRADIQISDSQRGSGYVHLERLGWQFGDFGSARFRQVAYRFTPVEMFDRTFLVGHLTWPPASEAAFDLLCSDLAKTVARPVPEWRKFENRERL